MNHFLTKVSKKFNINNEQLQTDYKAFDEIHSVYSKMKKTELVEECTKQGYKNKGTKDELIVCLIDQVVETAAPKLIKTKVKVVIEKTQAKTPSLVCRKNKFGLLQIDSTNLIFDQKSNKISGKQIDDGSLSLLNQEDLDLCKKLGLDFSLPENLEPNSNNEVAEDNIDDLLGGENQEGECMEDDAQSDEGDDEGGCE